MKEKSSRIKSNSVKILTTFCILLLVISSFSVAAGALVPEDEQNEKIMLIEDKNLEDVKQLGQKEEIEIIESYRDGILVRVKEESIMTLREKGWQLDELPGRTEISIKGNTFDIKEKETENNRELHIDDYESGDKGIYLVHMLGPVKPEWRNTLEKKGANVLNYVPNYAYEVIMTPEQSENIEELSFVDWVGIYQPEYKLDHEVKPESVNVHLRPDLETKDVIDLQGFKNLKTQQFRGKNKFTIEVNSIRELHELAKMNEVYYISPNVEPNLHAEMDTQTIGGGLWFMDDGYGHPSIPYRKHGDYGAYINQIGYTGEDNTIAVADSGIGDGTTGNAGVEDFTGRVIGGYGFGDDRGDWSDGMYHGTATTGLIAGDTYGGTGATYDEYDGFADYYMGQGLSYDSDLFASKIFTADGDFLPDNYYEIIEEPKKHSDAYIHSNSWGANTMGEYIVTDKQFDKGVRDANQEKDGNQPMVITASAGNSGGSNMFEQEIGSPGNAKNLITVGGSKPYNPTEGYENPENMYSVSSRGWTQDNRVKPDVIAPGENIITQNTPLKDGTYVSSSGTSFSNPLVAGAASVVVDWYNSTYGERPSPAMVRSLLINTANDMDPEGTVRGHIPNRDEGWGMVDISKLEYPLEDPTDFMVNDQESLLTTGETDEYSVSYQKEDEPLKITLGWTDKYALPGDSQNGTPTLKNNLDLEVETPSGKIIRGNAFDKSGDGTSDDGFTYPEAEVMGDFDFNDDGWDDVNNVENVYIPVENLEKGTYTVKVHGTNIPADANNDSKANQDYALTAYNVPYLNQPSKDGKIEITREKYSGDDKVGVTLSDYDLMEEGSFDVNITSELNGDILDEKVITLIEDEDNPGVFKSYINTTKDSTEEGLYVEHGAEMVVEYLDEDPGPAEEKTLESFSMSTIGDKKSNDLTEVSDDTGVTEIISPEEWVNSEYTHSVKSVVHNFGTENKTDVPVNTTINEKVPLIDENFSGEFPPSGWDTEGWKQADDNEAGGDAPEAQLDPLQESAHLTTKDINTSDYQKMSLEFKSYIEHNYWGDPVDVKVLVRDDLNSSWTDITPWNNPVRDDIGPETYSMDVTDQIGEGTQVRFDFQGGTSDLDYWAVDDMSLYKEPVRYSNETTVDVLAGENTTAVFESWTPSNEGQFYMNSTTEMDLDKNTENDYKTQDILVENVHDVSVEDILSPVGIPPTGKVPNETQSVKVNVQNQGTFDENSVPVNVTIDKIPEMLKEDFDDGIPSSWTVQNLSSQTWEYDSTYDAAMVEENNGEWMDEWLISPAIDASQAQGTLLEFDHRIFNSTFGGDSPIRGKVMVSSDNGTTWNEIKEYSPDGGESDDGVREFDISSYADGQSEVKAAFVYNSTDTSPTGSDWRIRDMRVYYKEDEYKASTDVDLGYDDQNEVSLKDWTPSEEERYRLNFSIDLDDDMDSSNDMITEEIEVETVHNLAATEIISPVGTVPEDTHNVRAEVDNLGNTAENNISVEAEIEKMAELLYEDFENEIPDNWTIENQTSTTWHHETSYDGEYAYVEGVDDQWQDERLITPSMDVSAATGTGLQINHEFDVSSYSGDSAGEIKISNDGGTSWEVLDSFDTDESGPTDYDISGYADGQSDVKLAFVFNSTDTAGEGSSDDWEIHDVFVYHQEDEYFDENTIDIGIGEQLEFDFAQWTPSSEDRYLLNITTLLGEDIDTSNDYMEEEIKVKTIHDMGVNDIISPIGTVRDETQEVLSTVENYGNIEETGVGVNVTIESLTEVLYEDFVGGIPGDWTIDNYSSTSWFHDVTYDDDHVALVEGSSGEMKEERLISPEMNLSRVTGSKLEVEHNFNNESGYGSSSGEILITSDGGNNWSTLDTFTAEESGTEKYDISAYVDGQSNVQIAFLFNSDEEAQDYDDWEIYDAFVYHREDEYTDEVTKDFAPEDQKEIGFENWTPSSTDFYEVNVTTLLGEDMDTSNDGLVERISVTDKEHDISANEITRPNSTVWNEIQPIRANVTNHGDFVEENFPINVKAERISGVMEQFSGDFAPEGWETDDWKQSDTNRAGGISPEAELDWMEVDGEFANLTTPHINTEGRDELILEFNSHIDIMPDGEFESRVLIRSNLYEGWTDITPWENPVNEELDPDRYSLDVSNYTGSGTQVRFGFEGDNSDLNRWYIDDVVLGTPEEEYTDDRNIDLNIGESTAIEFNDWTPSVAGEYIFEVTANLSEDDNLENDTVTKMIEVRPMVYDLEATSIDSPKETINQYQQEVMGTVTNVGNRNITDASVNMTIEEIHDILEMEESFDSGLPTDWKAEDKDGNGNNWTDEYGEYMQVISKNDFENNVLWSETINCTEGTHKVYLEFNSEYAGTNDRELLISTDGGETSRRIKRNIGKGELSFDITEFVSGEDQVKIGWEFYTEVAEEDEYWRIDNVSVRNEYVTSEYESQRSLSDINITEESQVTFDNWTPVSSITDYLLTMTTHHGGDQNLDNSILKKRIFVDHNHPPKGPENPSPYDGKEGVTHSPDLKVNVSDLDNDEMDVTFNLLDKNGNHLRNNTVNNVNSGTMALTQFKLIDSNTTFQWYVEVSDGYETNVSETWTFHTYEPEPILKTDNATIDTKAPERVKNLTVDWKGEPAITRKNVWHDDVENGNIGYTTNASNEDASKWGIREHGSAIGNHSWDWGNGEFNKKMFVGMKSSLVTPEIEVPENGDMVEFRFQHWRDFGDSSLYDGGNLKLSTSGANGEFEVVHPKEGYDGDISEDYGNPLDGEPAWGGQKSWEYASFDLTEYQGEKIHLRWDAGTDALDELKGEGWRIDDIQLNLLFEQNYFGSVAGNELSWEPSPDDGTGAEDVDHYEIYRSKNSEGPWNDETRINRISAKDTETYTYLDEDKAVDGTQWHYAVRTVDDVGNREVNSDSIVEAPLPSSTVVEPSDGSEVEGTDQELSVEVGTPTGDPLWVGFYDAETDILLGEHSGVTNEIVSINWNTDEGEMADTHSWYVVTSYEDKNVRDITEEWDFYLKDTVEPSADAGENIEADQGDTVTLNGSTSTDNVGVENYTWMIEEPTGEETLRYGKTIEYELQHAESYNVELKVLDKSGNNDTDTTKVYAWDTEDPIANCGHSISVGIDEEFTLNGSASTDNVEITNYTWVIEGVKGDAKGYSEEIEGEQVKHSLPKMGAYDVTLKAKDVQENLDTDKISVIVLDDKSPTAEAGEDITVDMEEEFSVDATGSTDNVGIVSYTWSIGDEELTGAQQTHAFEDAGEYEVTLTVEDEEGNMDTDKLTITVIDTEGPEAEAGSNITVEMSEEFVLNASESTDNIGVASYTWNIDGAYKKGKVVSHKFDEAGTYVVILTVKDYSRNTATDDVFVEVKDTVQPEANIEDIDDIKEGDKIVLSADKSTDNSDIKEYKWSINGGEIEYGGKMVEHAFETAGEHEVTLTVIDEAGNEDTKTFTVNVGEEEEEEEEEKESNNWIFAPILLLAGGIFYLIWRLNRTKSELSEKESKETEKTLDEQNNMDEQIDEDTEEPLENGGNEELIDDLQR